jgi:hypothetical protein
MFSVWSYSAEVGDNPRQQTATAVSKGKVTGTRAVSRTRRRPAKTYGRYPLLHQPNVQMSLELEPEKLTPFASACRQQASKATSNRRRSASRSLPTSAGKLKSALACPPGE